MVSNFVRQCNDRLESKWGYFIHHRFEILLCTIPWLVADNEDFSGARVLVYIHNFSIYSCMVQQKGKVPFLKWRPTMRFGKFLSIPEPQNGWMKTQFIDFCGAAIRFKQQSEVHIKYYTHIVYWVFWRQFWIVSERYRQEERRLRLEKLSNLSFLRNRWSILSYVEILDF